ncbi:hypothetical protein BKA83DRAFT_4125790 [Pisolithus microcarpus]|nr:hypothetical protein BKA83DRAFT_4125790 [Pisolithus microcarpus]
MPTCVRIFTIVIYLLLASTFNVRLPFMSPQTNKFQTVDSIHKLGSYLVPKEGHTVVMMDKITAQECQGAIITETASTNTLHNCLKITERYPDDEEILLYDQNAWNWPLPKHTMAPRDKEGKGKGGWQEIHLSAFFNVVVLAIKPSLKAQVLLMVLVLTIARPGNPHTASRKHSIQKHILFYLTNHGGNLYWAYPFCSISPLFNIDSNPKAFVAILAAVMFGPHQCIGFDPTLTEQESDNLITHPGLNKLMQPVTLPNHVKTITQNVLPAFILPPGMNANILFTSPTPNQLAGPTPNQTSTPNNPAGPVGVIQVHDMVYEIMEILFLSGRFLGRGTVVYCKRHKGWMYIIKDHWVENPSQERNMMKFLKGMPGVLSLIDH